MAETQNPPLNNLLDALVAGGFLVLVSVVIVLSGIDWVLLLTRRKPAVLHETEPVWLPDYAVVERRQKLGGAAGAAALALALAKELSGEAQLERAQDHATHCQCGPTEQEEGAAQKIYVRSRNNVSTACDDVAEIPSRISSPQNSIRQPRGPDLTYWPCATHRTFWRII